MQIGTKQLHHPAPEVMEEMESEGQFRPEPGSREEAGERLLEIGDEMYDLLLEAWGLVEQWGDETDRSAAERYWYGRMKISLGRGMSRGSQTLPATARAFMGDAVVEGEPLSETRWAKLAGVLQD